MLWGCHYLRPRHFEELEQLCGHGVDKRMRQKIFEKLERVFEDGIEQIWIAQSQDDTQVALVEAGKVLEVFVEHQAVQNLRGNIYVGRVSGLFLHCRVHLLT